MYFQYYLDARGEWRWRYRAANIETIANSSEGYSTRQACLYSISLVKQSQNAPVYESSS